MKSTPLIFLGICWSLFASAQMPGPGSRPPAIGHVYGKLIDPEGKAISDASVYVMQSKYDSVSRKMRDILLKGTVTTANGEFSVDELPVFGKLTLSISAVGYRPYEKDISFMTRPPGNGAQKPSQGAAGMGGPPGNMVNAFDKDLGNIKLAVGAKQLEGWFFIRKTGPRLFCDQQDHDLSIRNEDLWKI